MTTPYYDRDGITIYCGDCLEVMALFPDSSIDLILADPPYGTTHLAWDSIIPFDKMWESFDRILKYSKLSILMAKQPFTTLLGYSNIKNLRYELIWSKSGGGEFLNANRKPLPRHENILIFYSKQPTYNPQKTKGSPYTCTSTGVGATTKDVTVIGWETVNIGDRFPISVLKYKNDIGFHPTQKPVALMEYLIRTYTNPDELILDNTMGSGTTLVAAQNEGRRAVGIEINEEYCKIAVERLRQRSIFSVIS